MGHGPLIKIRDGELFEMARQVCPFIPEGLAVAGNGDMHIVCCDVVGQGMLSIHTIQYKGALFIVLACSDAYGWGARF